jgi:HD domain
MTVPVGPDGALAVYSAVGDAFAGRRIGFGRRRAALAANFARHRERDEERVAASWVAGLLAEIGCAARDAAEGEQPAGPTGPLPTDPDAPLHGAHLIAALPGLPPGTADLVRWHRERDDGTGFPDRLRWDGIPPDAAALGIAHAFLDLVEDAEQPRAPEEAVFAITAESGRAFAVELVRAFREFIGTTPGGWDAAPNVVAPALDVHDILSALSPSLEAARGDEETSSQSTTAVTFIPRLPIDDVAERVNAAVGAAVSHPMLILSLVIATHGFYVRPGAPA